MGDVAYASVNPHLPTGRGHLLAYTLSALTTLLWVGCVLPAGDAAREVLEDSLTPMHREAWLLVPALLLLIVAPVGMVLAYTERGLAAVLAATDAFVAVYMATVLAGWGAFGGTVSGLLGGVLFGLGVLSIVEVFRLLLDKRGSFLPPAFRGVRLALCLLVLLTPAWLLVQDGWELASLLVPYGLVAVGSGGVLLARTETGLRFTAASLHLAFAAHLFVVLRYTIFEVDTARRPGLVEVSGFGWATLGVAVLVLLLALLQVIRLGRHLRAETLDARAVAEPTG